MRIPFLLAACALASGCSTIEPLRPDMEARPVPSRLDEIAYINGMRRALEYSRPEQTPVGCYQGDKLKPFNPKFTQGYREFDEAAEHTKVQANSCLTFKESSGNSTASKIEEYLANGYGLVDLYCSRFFIIAGETRQVRKLQKDSATSVSTLVQGVLHAIGATEHALTSATLGFGLIDSTYKNIDAAFVITPEHETLIHLVQTAQSAYRTQSRATAALTFPEARSRIERYASMCTFDGMQQLVNASLNESSKQLTKEKKNQAGEAANPPEALTPPIKSPAAQPPTPMSDAVLPPL